ncbi:MAG: hypothetical protein M3441_15420, partial [Chloroflexota bacterium]|nr:hypothetical protein [Chloroflexota bacterium]
MSNNMRSGTTKVAAITGLLMMAALVAGLFAPRSLGAPHATPTIDGTITAGEYGNHTDGQNAKTSGTQIWYMTWDETNLYVAIDNANVGEGAVLYIDADPLIPPRGGTNANGSLAGKEYDNTNFAQLPFRADFVTYFKNGYREYRTDDGANGWSAQVAGFGAYADDTVDTRELAIPWSAITGAGRPASFNFFGYVTSGSGFVFAQVPPSNPGGTIGTAAVYDNYYEVTSTDSQTGTPPFSQERNATVAATETATLTATVAITATGTATEVLSATTTATEEAATATSTATSTATVIEEETKEPTSTATSTSPVLPSSTASATPAETNTSTATTIPSSTGTSTTVASATSTQTSAPSNTATTVPSGTSTATAMASSTGTSTATRTSTSVASTTATRTVTGTGTAMATASRTPGNGRVAICHRTGSERNPWVQIEVSENALPAHQAHGDIYPVPPNGCPGPGTPA